jgi:AAA+ ATPase superfamily predicted ATPase
VRRIFCHREIVPSAPSHPSNPFHYGREVDHLVDRDADVEAVLRVIENVGTLFFIGPRRFGKTSVLKAAGAQAARGGVVVLRYDAEAYERIDLLAAALLAGAIREFSTTLDKAQSLATQFFAKLRPSLSFDVTEQKFTVELGASGRAERPRAIPALTDVLHGIERLAASHQRTAAVIIDEFQQVIAEGGERAEKQIRAAVQTHHNVAYVFAGSRTRLLTDMISTAARPFWHLGDQRFLGPILRVDFRPFLTTGLESAGASVSPDAVEHILDRAQDVPYNVQQLASACWTALRIGDATGLTSADVDATLRTIVDELHPVYMQEWLSLTTAQKQTFRLITTAPAGASDNLTELALTGGLPRTTMQRALSALEARHVLRQEFTRTGVEWRAEDPFFVFWFHEVLAQ